MNPSLKITLIFALFLLVKPLDAQQDPLYSMYMYDKMLINPAFTGSSNWVVATIKNRNQFSGLNGNPKTQTFNIHGPLQKKHLGIGFKLINDKIALQTNLNAALALSYHLNFAGGKLSAGIEAGLLNRKTDYQKLILSNRNDNAIPLGTVSSVVPDLSVGLYYQKKQFYAGLSNYHLVKKDFDNKGASSQSHLYSHLYLIAGSVFDITKNWSIEPSLLLKYQPSSALQIDLNATVYYNEKIGAGIQYRSGDAIAATLRFNVTENLRIAYSYDRTVSRLSPYSKGSHEIIISYAIKLPPPPTQKEIHPRYYF